MTELRHTPMYDEMVERAAAIARERGDEFVDVVHVALAIFTDPESVPNRELRYRVRNGNVDELVQRLHGYWDQPIPGPGEHRVRPLDGNVLVRRDDTLEVVETFNPAE